MIDSKTLLRDRDRIQVCNVVFGYYLQSPPQPAGQTDEAVQAATYDVRLRGDFRLFDEPDGPRKSTSPETIFTKIVEALRQYTAHVVCSATILTDEVPRPPCLSDAETVLSLSPEDACGLP